MRRTAFSLLFATLIAGGCSNYELPPRVRAVDVEGCSSCDGLALTEDSFFLGPATVQARFIAEDPNGRLGEVLMSVRSPSGATMTRTCVYAQDLVAPPSEGRCDVLPSSVQALALGDMEVSAQAVETGGGLGGSLPAVDENGNVFEVSLNFLPRRLEGREQVEMSTSLGFVPDVVGTYELEAWVARTDGTTSNKLRATFTVTDADVMPDDAETDGGVETDTETG
ncbi:MAG: hypothetical protein AAGA54_02305 [Myxococcota bacterium]